MNDHEEPRRLVVDPVACDAYGFCAELLPERVQLDEWGYPVVDGAPLPAGLLSRARTAIRACPRRALLFRPPSEDRVRTGWVETPGGRSAG